MISTEEKCDLHRKVFLYINKEYESKQYNNAHPFAHLFGGLATLLVALFGTGNFNQFEYY